MTTTDTSTGTPVYRSYYTLLSNDGRKLELKVELATSGDSLEICIGEDLVVAIDNFSGAHGELQHPSVCVWPDKDDDAPQHIIHVPRWLE